MRFHENSASKSCHLCYFLSEWFTTTTTNSNTRFLPRWRKGIRIHINYLNKQINCTVFTRVEIKEQNQGWKVLKAREDNNFSLNKKNGVKLVELCLTWIPFSTQLRTKKQEKWIKWPNCHRQNLKWWDNTMFTSCCCSISVSINYMDKKIAFYSLFSYLHSMH